MQCQRPQLNAFRRLKPSRLELARLQIMVASQAAILADFLYKLSTTLLMFSIVSSAVG